MLYVPTMMYFVTWMQLTYFARFAIAFVCHCVYLPSHAPQARKKIFYERLKVKFADCPQPRSACVEMNHRVRGARLPCRPDSQAQRRWTLCLILGYNGSNTTNPSRASPVP